MFRAWDKEYKKMEYVGQIHYSHPRGTCPGNITYICTDKFDDLIEIERFELMQFTGLKDKNGKEIYEGDILTHHYHHENGVMEFNERRASFELKYFQDGSYQEMFLIEAPHFEIIGNVYETPELLK